MRSATASVYRSTRTHAGDLHLVTETAAGDDFDLLIRNAVKMHVDSGILAPVAALDELIRFRRAGRTPGDRAAAATLRAVDELARQLQERHSTATDE